MSDNLSQRKVCLFPEGPHQGDAALGATELAASLVSELCPIARAEVGQGMMFEMSPNVFGRVEFWSVGGESCNGQVPVGLIDELLHQAAAMGRKSIPDNEEGSADLSSQVSEEIDHLWRANTTPVEPKVEAPPCDTGHHRQFSPVERKVQLRRLPPGGPCAPQRRLLTQPAFVNEDKGAALAAGLFFSAGHVWRFQRAMAFSSRSVARPVGRWQLHPMRARTFQRCAG